MKLIWDKEHSQYTVEEQLWIWLSEDLGGNEFHRNSTGWHKMPMDVYFNKIYPTCHCGRKYVPIKKSKECFFCLFTRK